MSDFLNYRVKALELELKATRKAFAEHMRSISDEAAYDILDLAVERIKSKLNNQENGEKTPIQNDQHQG
jgi:hypothetical protein